jgi:hypothetical protein
MRWAIVAAALVSPAAAAVLYWVKPTDGGFYPPCLLFSLTGLHCPFCGSTRCAHALLHGELNQAAAFNALAVVLIPVAAGWCYWAAYRVLRRQPLPPFSPPHWLLRMALIVIITFALVRNLPFFPFVLLAPHELAP